MSAPAGRYWATITVVVEYSPVDNETAQHALDQLTIELRRGTRNMTWRHRAAMTLRMTHSAIYVGRAPGPTQS